MTPVLILAVIGLKIMRKRMCVCVQEIFEDDANASWFINGGREMLATIISKADKVHTVVHCSVNIFISRY